MQILPLRYSAQSVPGGPARPPRCGLITFSTGRALTARRRATAVAVVLLPARALAAWLPRLPPQPLDRPPAWREARPGAPPAIERQRGKMRYSTLRDRKS